MSRHKDELLYIISAKKEIPWLSFKQVFDYLYTTASGVDIDGIKHKRFLTVSALDSLGHCDFDFGDNYSKVYAAPPVLVRLPCAGFPQAILTGSRSPRTIEKLSNLCQSVGQQIYVEVTEQASELVLAPRRLSVQAEDLQELQAIASKLAIPFIETPSAWSLLNFAASLKDYLATCQWSTNSELTWKRKTFDPNLLQFCHTPEINSNIRLSQYSHPSRNTQIYYLIQEEKCTQINRDWGRYAVLKAAKVNVLIYDKRRFIMAVPVSAKLPRLLERALTLCSGYAATFAENLPDYNSQIRGFNLFRAIPPQIAELTATKIGQTLLLKSLDIKL